MAAITGVLARPTAYAGVWGWLATVDHKRIGILYGVSGVRIPAGGWYRSRGNAHATGPARF